MRTIDLMITIATGGHTFYFPVPARGNVSAVRVACNATMAATGTLIVSRATDAVNTVTIPAGDIAAGTIYDGVPDTTNKALLFDKASATATHQVLKIVTDATFVGGAAMLSLSVDFDDTAYIRQAPLEE